MTISIDGLCECDGQLGPECVLIESFLRPLKFRISGVRSCRRRWRMGNHPLPIRAMPPRRPQLECRESSSESRARGPPTKCHTRRPPHALTRPWLSPLTTFSDRHTPHALVLTPTTDHTALSSPSKSQKSLHMRAA